MLIRMLKFFKLDENQTVTKFKKKTLLFATFLSSTVFKLCKIIGTDLAKSFKTDKLQVGRRFC